MLERHPFLPPLVGCQAGKEPRASLGYTPGALPHFRHAIARQLQGGGISYTSGFRATIPGCQSFLWAMKALGGRKAFSIACDAAAQS